MGRFKQRLTITPIGRLAGWRRLKEDKMAFSGQFFPRSSKGCFRLKTRNAKYISYIEFDIIKFYPKLSKHWEEHYNGEKDGEAYVLYLKKAAADQSQGPLL